MYDFNGNGYLDIHDYLLLAWAFAGAATDAAVSLLNDVLAAVNEAARARLDSGVHPW